MLWTFRMIGRAGGAAEAEDIGRGSKSVPLYKHYIKILNLWCNKKRVLKERESEEARGKARERNRKRVKKGSGREGRGGECQHACWKGTWHDIGFGFRLFFFGFVCVVEREPVGKSGNELKKTRIMKIGQSVAAAKRKHFPIYHTVTQTTPEKKETLDPGMTSFNDLPDRTNPFEHPPLKWSFNEKKKENNINGNCSLSPRFNDNKGMAQLGGCHCSKG